MTETKKQLGFQTVLACGEVEFHDQDFLAKGPDAIQLGYEAVRVG